MKKFINIVALLGSTLIASAAIAAETKRLPVTIGSAVLVDVNRSIGEIILGNPIIADIGVLSSKRIAITAKEIGVTSLIISDKNGKKLKDLSVLVTPDERQVVTLYRPGQDNQNYICILSCAPSAGNTNDNSSRAQQIADEYLQNSLQEAARRYQPSVEDYGPENPDPEFSELGAPVRR